MASSTFPSVVTGVTVQTATSGALSGDGSSGNKLQVNVDGLTITVNGSNELVASGGAPADWAWTSDLLASGVGSDGQLALRRIAETLDAVVTIFDNGTAASSLSDIVADDDSPYFFRMWNKTYTSNPLAGLAAYQYSSGAVLFGVGLDGTASAISYGTGLSSLSITDAGSIPTIASFPGVVLDAHVGEVFGFSEQQVDPEAPSVTNVGTPGAATVSYKLVGRLGGYSAYPANVHSAASSAGTTSTANATLDGTNFNRLSFTWPDGFLYVDVYRTAGGPSQGLIGTITGSVRGTVTFDDTGLPGDSAVPPSTNTTGNVTLASAGGTLILDALGNSTASGIVKAGGYKSSDGTAGATLTFQTGDGKTGTVKNGLIVSVA